MNPETQYSAFHETRFLGTGPLGKVLTLVKQFLEDGGTEPVLIFDHTDGRQHDFDFRGNVEEVLTRALPQLAKPGPGRPKLGIQSREVTLLPRHWDWLERQPGKASATLRRLVEAAMKARTPEEAAQQKVEAAVRIMTAVGGNLPMFEEATRALYGRDLERFGQLSYNWPDGLLRVIRKVLA